MPILFCLHFLGGSARAWRGLDALTGVCGKIRAIDLPGFGDASDASSHSVASMRDYVIAAIRAEGAERWVLVGHSMGAKVAMAVARAAEDGEDGLDGLEALVLLAGSPPAPEPISDAQRQAMLGWFEGDAESSRSQAEDYISHNVGAALPPALHAQAVDDVLRADRVAWRAWLEQGSREDWRERIGVLRTPALIVAGGKDEALGADAQQRLMAPHFLHPRLAVIPHAGHLLPMEAPAQLAALIGEQLDGRGQDYHALILSARVSARTRDALLARAEPDAVAYQPRALDEGSLETLRATLDCVLPQKATPPIDLAARLDRQMAEGGDGWRFDALPPDAQSCRLAARTIDAMAMARHNRAFASLGQTARHDILTLVSRGEADAERPSTGAALSPFQMKLWFEDICGEATKLYVAHPRTLARLGYSGIAYGGDTRPLSGFQQIGIAEREAWEPLAGGCLPS